MLNIRSAFPRRSTETVGSCEKKRYSPTRIVNYLCNIVTVAFSLLRFYKCPIIIGSQQITTHQHPGRLLPKDLGAHNLFSLNELDKNACASK